METSSAPSALAARRRRFEELYSESFDVLVVGGGITGCGVALDLAVRGMRVAVVERGDWAQATSSASSRLIHGGLRYLEQLEFGLVRESCLERGLLLRNAAGYVWPETFTFPVHRGDAVGRSKLLAGLWLYTLVSLPRPLGRPRYLSRAQVHARLPGLNGQALRGGGSYLDGATDDARLTLAVLLTARERGAVALSHTEVLSFESGRTGVAARLVDRLDGGTCEVRASEVVLAGGPFTNDLRARAGLTGTWVQPTRGTHLLVPRDLLPTDGAVIFPSPVDGRILFLLPGPRTTVIGTTDIDAPPSDEVHATAREVDYLLASAGGLVPGARLRREDVIATWSGLRPLLAAPGREPSERSREERAERDGHLWTIAGGKLTAWRSMAEKLGGRLAGVLGRGDAGARSPTRDLRLRGALSSPAARPPWSALGGGIAARDEGRGEAWTRRYAALAPAVEERVARSEEGARPLAEDTLLGEVDWAVEHEDCLTAEDFLFRRTHLAHALPAEAAAAGEAVIERLAGLLAWNDGRIAAERAALDTALGRLHAWRDE